MYVHSKCLKGVALITVSDGNGRFPSFVLVGSSVPTSAITGDEVQQLTVFPKEGQNGVVAISSFTSRNGLRECLAIRISWKDDKIVVDGSTDGNPSRGQGFFNPNRIGQLYAGEGSQAESWIEVQIGGRRYTSSSYRVKSLTTHFVPDNDTLCRYWAGNAAPIEVIHAAVQSKVEVRREEVLRQQLMSAQGEEQRLREKLGDKLDELKNLRCAYHFCYGTALALAGQLRTRWFLSKKDKAILVHASSQVLKEADE